jgi:methylated-DNA-protein-cysteine methyltransferase-like protein
MNEFSKRVYDTVKEIPAGCVMTYGQVARLAGNPRGARGVGFILHRNPEPGVIPCHRVVFKNGGVCTGYAFGGPDVQRSLLEGEGVIFLRDGRVDMKASGMF